MKLERSGAEWVVETASEEETCALGAALAGLVEPGVVIGLIGPLGAGKTRLTRALAEALGVDRDAITSPTFTLIHEYEGPIPIFHFDTYRLKSVAEFDALGAEEYWDAGGVCLVEWADRVADRLPGDAWFVTIELAGTASRRFRFRWPEGSPWAERLAARFAV